MARILQAALHPSSATGAHWSQQPMHSGPPRPAFNGPKFEQATPLNGSANLGAGGGGGSMWGSGGSASGSGGGLWGPIEEHPDNHMLPGGLLGGQ